MSKYLASEFSVRGTIIWITGLVFYVKIEDDTSCLVCVSNFPKLRPFNLISFELSIIFYKNSRTLLSPSTTTRTTALPPRHPLDNKPIFYAPLLPSTAYNLVKEPAGERRIIKIPRALQQNPRTRLSPS